MGCLPRDFAAVHVIGGESAVGRFDYRQSSDPDLIELVLVLVSARGRILDGLHANHDVRPPGREVQITGFWIVSGAAPIRAAAPAGHLDRSLLGRRGEQRSESIGLHRRKRLRSQLRREVDQVVFRDALHLERRGLRRERLRLGDRFEFAGRDRPVLDRPDRLSRPSIEHIEEPCLRDLHERRNLPPLHLDVDQVRGRRQIPVPDIVSNGLEMPHPLAGLGV